MTRQFLNIKFSSNILFSLKFTGLEIGSKIRIPGEEISAIISKLWKLDLFSDINFYLTNVQDGEASIQIDIIELPTLSEYKITSKHQ